MTTVSYPFDTTGKADTNLVTNELHTLTEVNSAPYRLLIPVASPFYLNNLLLEHIDESGAVRELIEGVDYYNALIYMAASRSTGRPVYGGWSINNALINGTIRCQYQTVGGPWVADSAYVYQQLLENQANPRTVYWDQITNIQDLFPPTPHTDNIQDFTGLDSVLATMDSIRQAILDAPNNLPGTFMAHIQSTGNPHKLTLTDLGLQDLQPLPLATDDEVLRLADVQKYVSLDQLRKLFQSLNLA